jgi:hypothetical protein
MCKSQKLHKIINVYHVIIRPKITTESCDALAKRPNKSSSFHLKIAIEEFKEFN